MSGSLPCRMTSNVFAGSTVKVRETVRWQDKSRTVDRPIGDKKPKNFNAPSHGAIRPRTVRRAASLCPGEEIYAVWPKGAP
jgi:hypothetical protein